jgi:hypothetical protein
MACCYAVGWANVCGTFVGPGRDADGNADLDPDDAANLDRNRYHNAANLNADTNAAPNGNGYTTNRY